MAADTLQTFGETLKAARLKQGCSLDALASSLKINRRHLESIEAGDLSSLPQGPYITAFVREYARALGLEVPAEYASPNGQASAGIRDPKVVSHPARNAAKLGERHIAHDAGAQISHVARDTARFAKSAVKTVTKTTGNVVNMVESGSKEALEVLTSKDLWEEAENTRRERHGLPPLERKQEATIPAHAEPVQQIEVAEETQQSPYAPSKETFRLKTSKRTTNLVIVLLALLFAGAAYFAIKMSGGGSSSAVANKDYIPAPVDKPAPLPANKNTNVKPPVVVPNTPAGTKDSLSFVLRATQSVWVSVSPDGIPAYRGELKAGDVKSFRAASKFVINLGNQKSVAMDFNGARLTSLPTIANSSVVVRDLVLMRDKATLDGAPFDIHKPATVVATPKPVAVTPPPVVVHKPVPVPSKSSSKSSAVKSKIDAKSKPVAKHNAPKPRPQPKPKKKPAVKNTVPMLHSVEPVAPRP